MASKAVLDLIVSLKDNASQGLANIGSNVAKVGSMAATAGLAVGGALAVGLGAAAGAGLSFNSSMEQVEAQLNAFLKDGELVAGTLEMIKRRAAQTPFAFEDMARATTSLIPAAKASGENLEDLIGTAEILAALNPAEGLEGAAYAIKSALSGDFVSIIDRFDIPRQRLNELKEQGVPALEAIQIAMKEMGIDASLVSNMAQTASGRWSTFMDTLQGLAATATSGVFKGMSATLGRINEALADPAVQERLNAVAEVIGQKLAAAFDWLVGVGGKVVGVIQAFQKALAGEWIESWLMSPVEQVAVALGRMFAAFQQGGNPFAVFEDGSSYIGSILEALGMSEGAAQRVGQAVKELADGAMWGFQMMKDAVATFQQALAGDWVDSGIIHPFHRVIGVIGQVVAAFQEGGLQGALDTLLPYLQTAFANILAWIQAQAAPLLASLMAWKDAFLAWIGPATVEFLLQWPGMLDQFLTWIEGAAGPILQQLGEWAIAFLEWIVPMIPDILINLGLVLAAILVWMVETSVVLWDHILTEWVPALLDWIGEELIPRLWPELQKVDATIKGWILAAAEGVLTAAAGLGTSLIDGFINGIQGAGGRLINAARGAAQSVADTFTGFFDMHSPSRLMERYGDNVGGSFAGGLEGAAQRAIDAARSLSQGVAGSLSPAPALATAGAAGGPLAASGGLARGGVTIIINMPGLTIASSQDRASVEKGVSDAAYEGWLRATNAGTRQEGGV